MPRIHRSFSIGLIVIVAALWISLSPTTVSPNRAGAEGGVFVYLPFVGNNYTAGFGSVSGVISDARDGHLLDGLNDEAQVCYQTNCVFANSNGQYSITGLPSGAVLVTAKAQEYIDFNAVLLINTNSNTIQNFPMSPNDLGKGQYRIIVSWDDDPPDLDAHLWTPYNIGTRPHVFQENPGNCSGGQPTQSCLDLDDVDGWGPETITILEAPPAGVAFFHYAVEKFEPCFPDPPGCPAPIEASNAVVNVFGQTGQGGFQQTFVIPQQGNNGKRFWYVFSIEYDDFGFVAIHTTNCFTDAPNPIDDPPVCPP